MHQKS